MNKRHPAPSPLKKAHNGKTSPNHDSENFTNKITLIELSKEISPGWEKILKLTMERQ